MLVSFEHEMVSVGLCGAYTNKQIAIKSSNLLHLSWFSTDIEGSTG